MVPVVVSIPPALEMAPATTVPSPHLGGADKLTAEASQRHWDGLAGPPAPGLQGQQGPQWWLLQGSVASLSSLQVSAGTSTALPLGSPQEGLRCSLREMFPSPELPHLDAHLSSSSVVVVRRSPRQYFPGIHPRELSLMAKLPSLPFLLFLLFGFQLEPLLR